MKGATVRIRRWAIFGIMVATVFVTLFCMVWTTEKGKIVTVWLPDDSHGNVRLFYIASFLGHLDGSFETGSPPLGGGRPPRSIVVQNYRNIDIVYDGLTYWVILGLESVGLFFLVPSVLAGGKERIDQRT